MEVIISVALFTGPFVLLNWNRKKRQKIGIFLDGMRTSITFKQPIPSTGGNVLATIDIPTTEGGFSLDISALN